MVSMETLQHARILQSVKEADKTAEMLKDILQTVLCAVKQCWLSILCKDPVIIFSP